MLLSALALLLAIVRPAHADEPRTLDLREVLRLAGMKPPRVLAGEASLRRARAEVYDARGSYLPRMKAEASSGIAYDNRNTTPNKISIPPDVPPDQRDAYLRNARTPRYEATALNSQGSLTVDYTVVDASRAASIEVATRGAQAETGALAETRRAAQLFAAERYLASLAASALLDDARLTVVRRSEQFDAIGRLVRAGVRPSIDLTRAEIDLVAARNGVETRAIDVEASQSALAVAVGLDPNEPIQPTAVDDSSWPAPREPASASAQAIAGRPERARLDALLSARRASHRAALGARYPTLGLLGAGNVSHADVTAGTGIQGFAYGASGFVTLRWAALDPSVWRRAAVTRAAESEALYMQTSGTLALRAGAAEAAFAVKRARAQLAQSTQVLATAEVARDAQVQRYRAGVASLLELLDAEDIAQNARRQRIEAERDHRIARARLLSESGELDQLTR